MVVWSMMLTTLHVMFQCTFMVLCQKGFLHLKTYQSHSLDVQFPLFICSSSLSSSQGYCLFGSRFPCRRWGPSFYALDSSSGGPNCAITHKIIYEWVLQDEGWATKIAWEVGHAMLMARYRFFFHGLLLWLVKPRLEQPLAEIVSTKPHGQAFSWS